MATTTPPLFPSGSLLVGSTLSPSPTDPGPGNDDIPPISLCLYVFSIVLILFLMILGAFVSRSVRRRRQRSVAALTALTTGNYGQVTGLRGKFDSPPASKPVLWETRITPIDDEAKGWASIFPVAGTAMVPDAKAPEHDVKIQRLASWRSRMRFSPHPSHRPIVVDPSPSSVASSEPPASLSAPVDLTFLISMPTPLPHTKAGQENGGPPLVELGVAQVPYTPDVTR